MAKKTEVYFCPKSEKSITVTGALGHSYTATDKNPLMVYTEADIDSLRDNPHLVECDVSGKPTVGRIETLVRTSVVDTALEDLVYRLVRKVARRPLIEKYDGPVDDGTITLKYIAQDVIRIESYTGGSGILLEEGVDYSVEGDIITELQSIDYSTKTWFVTYTSSK